MSIQRPTTIRHRAALFQDATEIVSDEFGTELSLDEIARRVASSRRQLQRAYSEVGHTTFREHLTQIRMERAAELLASRRLTVREVAHRVGYRQPAQFAKAFRRAHGVPPSDYRGRGNGSGPDGAEGGLEALDGHGADDRRADLHRLGHLAERRLAAPRPLATAVGGRA